ncbi:LOW QUALITY PROTEIN: DDE_4 domain-containing protein, partial [Cephalotus follicularis]
IKVNVPSNEKSSYRTRNGEIVTNVLAVCLPKMQFIYILSGREGSIADSRVVRDAINIPSKGFYYLVDAGHTNYDGFLAPYRGKRYHLNEWRVANQWTTPKEFNMKYSSARNVVERCFGLLKLHWAILRSPSYYPIQIQIPIIMACCLLHNF